MIATTDSHEKPNRDAVAIAYVVDDETLFRRATDYALTNLGKKHWEQEIRGGLDAIVPKTVIGKPGVLPRVPPTSSFPSWRTEIYSHTISKGDIRTKRRAILYQLEHAAYRCVVAIHDKVTSLEPCAGAEEKLATYTLQMCHVKDGAYDLAATDMSLSEVWDGLDAAVEAFPESSGRKCAKTCEGGCAVDVREILARAVEENRAAVDGLCLRCVKGRVRGGGGGGSADGVGARLEKCDHEAED